MKFIRFLLFPFSILYYFITRIRNYFFDIGVLKSTKFDIPVIAVGNLSVGGTGKTPQIEYLIRLLKNKYNIAVLSRGYKRKTEGFILVDKNHTVEDVGDEPLQFAKKYDGISVAVDANRLNGIQQLQKLVNSEVILLDDAYQHRKVKAKHYILLTKYDDLYVDDFLLPTGNLRESSAGAKRASIIVVTKCPSDLTKQEQQQILTKINPEPHQEVFFTEISYSEKLSGYKNINVDDLQDYEVLLITGIANPNPLLSFLKAKNIKVTHLKFPDHYHFKADDLKNIKHSFEKITEPKKIILTTEKDFVRLENKLDNLSYLTIKTQFLGHQGEKFDKKILSYLS